MEDKKLSEQSLGYWAAVAHHFGEPKWDYWLSLAKWTARETACLCFDLDPDRYDTVAKNTLPQPRGLLEQINNIERRAGRDQTAGLLPDQASPLQWVQWAVRSGYAIPEKLLNSAAADMEKKVGVGDTPIKGAVQIQPEQNVNAGVTAHEPRGLPYKDIIIHFGLDGKWTEKLRKPRRSAAYKDAEVAPGIPRKGGSRTFNPAIFGSLLIRNKEPGFNILRVTAIMKKESLVDWIDEWDALAKEIVRSPF